MKMILESAHGILKRSSLSAEQLCERAFGIDENGNVRKSHWTLYQELNPNNPHAKLGAVDLYLLMEASEDVDPLRVMADGLGYYLVPKNALPDKQTISEEVCQDMEALGQWASICTNPAATEKNVREIAHKLRQEICETETLKLNIIQAVK